MRPGLRIAELLADRAADRQPAEVDRRQLETVEHVQHIVGQIPHRVGAGQSIAAAMTAQVDAQHTVARRQKRRHLLGPHAAVGSQRVRERHDRRVRCADEIEIQPMAAADDVHWASPCRSTQALARARTAISKVPSTGAEVSVITSPALTGPTPSGVPV